MSRASIGTPSTPRAVTVGVLVGVATGLASTFPRELGPAASLALWAIAGVLVGVGVGRDGRVPAGLGYGIALAVAFLYSRFGGGPSDLPAYSVFVLVASVVSAGAGVLTVHLGSRLRRARGRLRP
jgi:hypothetical protein